MCNAVYNKQSQVVVMCVVVMVVVVRLAELYWHSTFCLTQAVQINGKIFVEFYYLSNKMCDTIFLY